MRPGDRVYLYSDGLLEAMNPAGEVFGRERITMVIEDSRSNSIDESPDALIAAATAWQGGEAFTDDVSLLALSVGE